MKWFLPGAACAVFLLAIRASAQDHGVPLPRVSNTQLRITQLPVPEPGSIVLQRVFPRLVSLPGEPDTLQLLQPPDDSNRMFMVNRVGKISVFTKSPDPDPASLDTFLDLRPNICDAIEEGLLSMVFDPEYATNGIFYVFYNPLTNEVDCANRLAPHLSRISRFHNPNPAANFANRATEEVILQIPQDTGHHKGSFMQFGPDGMLYISIGDSGYPHPAQNTTDIRGSIIRIDLHAPPDPGLTYHIPTDNPFYNGGPAGTDTRKEIWAYGFRNPWRGSFDPLTGRLFIGDVGENTFEELDVIEPGGNYGWPIYEGPVCNEPNHCNLITQTPPVAGYYQAASGTPEAILAGFVYTAPTIPSLYGSFLFADIFGRMWGVRAKDDGTFEQTVLSEGIGISLAGFSQDRDGEVYLLEAYVNAPGIWVLRTAPPATSSFPKHLSDAPALLQTAKGSPSPGVIPYAPASPLWSDGARKERFLALPNTTQIGYRAEGGWDFPEETVIVKNFLLPTDLRTPDSSLRRIETRLLFRKDGDWRGFSYEWNDDESDASLLTTGKTKAFAITDASGAPAMQNWQYPSSTQCRACHTSASNGTLGLQTAQMNCDFDYPASGVRDNQLRAFNYVSLFSAPLPAAPDALPRMPNYQDTSASLENRAHAYLASNCAMCHQPGTAVISNLDFRWSTPIDRAHAISVIPFDYDLGIANARIIAPGDVARSVLIAHMKSTDPIDRMPPLATSKVDSQSVAMISQWIGTLTGATPDANWVLY
ncbi:hypothetical protein BH09SUM1_BH09SUM1_33880 [soil metagenome]